MSKLYLEDFRGANGGHFLLLGLTWSTFLASSTNFWLARIRLNSSSSEADLTTISLFLVADQQNQLDDIRCDFLPVTVSSISIDFSDAFFSPDSDIYMDFTPIIL
jgi:hypothetical protein